jgi:hypothetical protein
VYFLAEQQQQSRSRSSSSLERMKSMKRRGDSIVNTILAALVTVLLQLQAQTSLSFVPPVLVTLQRKQTQERQIRPQTTKLCDHRSSIADTTVLLLLLRLFLQVLQASGNHDRAIG